MRYLGGRGNSRIAKELSTGGGYVAMMVVIVVVAGAALFLALPRLKRNPQVGVVAFDIVGGVVFGGIVGREVISGWL